MTPLPTSPTMQQVFDHVARHLLTQKQRAFDPNIRTNTLGATGMCAYRAPDGCKCAAGCLIPDDLYSPAMERMNFSSVYTQFPALADRLCLTARTVDMVHELQRVHDMGTVENWPTLLYHSAKLFGLSTDVLNEFV